MYTCEDLLKGNPKHPFPNTLENVIEIEIAPEELTVEKMEHVFVELPITPQTLMRYCRKGDILKMDVGLEPRVYLANGRWIIVPKSDSIFKLKN